jgi:hypothetical protein
MDAKELQRYVRLLFEKRQELLTASPGAVIPAAGGVEGDPIDQATADAEAEINRNRWTAPAKGMGNRGKCLRNHRSINACPSGRVGTNTG